MGLEKFFRHPGGGRVKVDVVRKSFSTNDQNEVIRTYDRNAPVAADVECVVYPTATLHRPGALEREAHGLVSEGLALALMAVGTDILADDEVFVVEKDGHVVAAADQLGFVVRFVAQRHGYLEVYLERAGVEE